MSRFIDGLAPWQRGCVAALVNASVWSLLYFLFLRTPLPDGWTIGSAKGACLAAGVIGGVLACLTSRRLWPVALGAAVGIILGGAEAVVSDTLISYWQQIVDAMIMAPFPLYLWLCIVASWIGVSLALGRWPLPRVRARDTTERPPD